MIILEQALHVEVVFSFPHIPQKEAKSKVPQGQSLSTFT